MPSSPFVFFAFGGKMIPFMIVTEVLLVPVEFNEDGTVLKFEEEFVSVRVKIDDVLEYSPTTGGNTSAMAHLTTSKRSIFITEVAEQIDAYLAQHYGLDANN